MQNLGQYSNILLPLLLIGAMYFLVILPQKKREKAAREMLNAIKEGSDIVTIGGIMGKVININGDEVTIETSVEKTQLKFKKWSIKEILKVA